MNNLNQYLQGNVTAMGVIITLEDMVEFLKDSEGISENKEFDFKKYLAEGKLLKERKKIYKGYNEYFDKDSLLQSLGDADDAFIYLGDGKELLIYNPNSNNADNAAMWGDKSVFAVDQDGNEYEIDYADIERIEI